MKLAALALYAFPLTLPFVFQDDAFVNSFPQGVWIPFILALAFSSLRNALVVLVITMTVILTAYPSAFNSAPMVMASAIISVLLIVGRLIQDNALKRADEARQLAEKSETSLRDSELQYRTLVEKSPLAIQSFAPDGSSLWVNRAWETMWNVPFSAIGKYNLFQDRQLEEKGLRPLIDKVFAGESVEFPLIEYDKTKNTEVDNNGATLWVRTLAYPLHNQQGDLREFILIQEDVTERMQADLKIQQLAYYDPLTQLPNRRLLMDRIGKALAASERSQEFGALLFLDLDNFKMLNDSQGHAVGDGLLVEVAARITSMVRAGDTVARLGGDEYVIVLENIGKNEENSASHAEQIAEKVAAEVARPYTLNGRLTDIHCTTSIGITLFYGRELSVDTLYKQADVALYQAKNAGRNAIRFFDTSMQEAIDERIRLEADMRSGLTNHEFEVFYQPQVDAEGRIFGAEALLRWHHPNGKMIPPDRFIPLAEETGLIRPLGEWVLEAACEQLKAWQAKRAMRHMSIAVNISAVQFLQHDIIEQVRQCLKVHAIPPNSLKLELTETVVLKNLEIVVDAMQQLDALGVSFALDDFGMGYSSLSYLKRLPIREIKIDRTFIRDILTDTNDAAIVQAILAMCRTLGIDEIAEGVETEAQRKFLTTHGCQYYQGYLFGRPMPASELEKLMQRD